MSLAGYGAVVRRRLGVILATMAVSAAVAFAGTLLRHPTYQAVALLRLATPGAASVGRPQLDYGDRMMNTYVQLVDMGLLDARLAAAVEAATPPTYRVEALANSELLLATASHPDPAVAARAANALASLLQATNVTWMAGGAALPAAPAAAAAAAGSAPALLQIVEPAATPTEPAGPSARIVVALGLALGAIGGLGLAFLRERTDGTLHDAGAVAAAAGAPVLARFPDVPPARRRGRAAAGERAAVEEFRRLHLALFGAGRRPAARVVAVSGARPGAGASAVVSGLAHAAARYGHRVAVLDCDPVAPALHAMLRPRKGAIERARARFQEASARPDGEASPHDMVLATEIPGLDLWSPGLLSHDPSAVFQTSRLAPFLAQLREGYDVVLLDAASLLGSADGLLVGGQADGVLLVVEVGATDAATLRSAVTRLAACRATLLGVVANRDRKG